MAARHLRSDTADVQAAAMAFFEGIFSAAKVLPADNVLAVSLERAYIPLVDFICVCEPFENFSFGCQVHGPDHAAMAALVSGLLSRRPAAAVKSTASFAVSGAASAFPKSKMATANTARASPVHSGSPTSSSTGACVEVM